MWPILWFFALAISQLTDIDMDLARKFFDETARTFPLRNDFIWSHVLHDSIKHLSVFLWVALLVAAMRARWIYSMASYEPMVYVLITSALAVLINGFLKNKSAHSCPWSLKDFGGAADYFRLLATLPAKPGSGNCLPSGHASVAFMWWSAVYACARWYPKWRWHSAILVTCFGIFCGYVQMARGAHFLTHILISAAICGGIASITYHLPTIYSWLRTTFFMGTSRESRA